MTTSPFKLTEDDEAHIKERFFIPCAYCSHEVHGTRMCGANQRPSFCPLCKLGGRDMRHLSTVYGGDRYMHPRPYTVLRETRRT